MLKKLNAVKPEEVVEQTVELSASVVALIQEIVSCEKSTVADFIKLAIDELCGASLVDYNSSVHTVCNTNIHMVNVSSGRRPVDRGSVWKVPLELDKRSAPNSGLQDTHIFSSIKLDDLVLFYENTLGVTGYAIVHSTTQSRSKNEGTIHFSQVYSLKTPLSADSLSARVGYEVRTLRRIQSFDCSELKDVVERSK
jgi:hypothetical protein